ncbi:DUF2971 domain-containing protein, partial [Psychromonas aquatilis]
LNNKTLGFSNLVALNDPFEASYSYVHYFSSTERFNNLSKNNVEEAKCIERVKGIIDSELSKYVVTCFTRTPNEPLMWAHYAEQHKGVCYCFDKTQLFNGESYKYSDIQYSNRRAKVRFFENSTTKEELKSQLGDVICSKSDAWSYEKEFRYYAPSKSLIHNFEAKALVAIILGCRFNKDNIIKIKTLIDNYNNENNHIVKLYYSTMSGSLYEMVIQKMDVTSDDTRYDVVSNEEPIQ